MINILFVIYISILTYITSKPFMNKLNLESIKKKYLPYIHIQFIELSLSY